MRSSSSRMSAQNHNQGSAETAEQLEYYVEQLRLASKREATLQVTACGMIETTNDWIDQIEFRQSFPVLGCDGNVLSHSIDDSASIDLETVLRRPGVRKLIIGAPGIGKTKLLRWIGESIARDCVAGLRLPLRLDAGKFAIAQQQDVSLSPVEFVLRSVCDDDAEARTLAIMLREHCYDEPDTILLVDHWDAVPLQSRKPVLDAIQAEEQFILTLITARHHHRELQRFRRDEHVTSFGMLVHDSEPLNEWFPDGAASHSLHAFGSDSINSGPYHAESPYWARLISFALSNPVNGIGVDQALACEQAVAWERQRFNEENEKQPLNFPHLNVLAKLALDALRSHDGCDRRSSMQLSRHRIEQFAWKESIEPEPIFLCRILRRLHATSDQYAFTDRRIRSYLASLSFTRDLSADQQKALLTEALHDAELFDIIKHATASSEEFRETLRQNFSTLFEFDDRFHHVLVRLCELAKIANWSSRDLTSPANDLRDRVWYAIRQRERSHPSQVTDLVTALADLDRDYLQRRAINDLQSQHGLIPLIEDAACHHPLLMQKPERDRLSVSQQRWHLRRIAASPPTHPEVRSSLAELATSPTTQGHRLLIELAKDDALEDSLRCNAIEAIKSFVNENAIAKEICSIYETTTADRVRQSVTGLANRQPLCLNLETLERAILDEVDAERRKEQLVACFASYTVRPTVEAPRIRRMFATLISEGLTTKGAKTFDEVWESLKRARGVWQSTSRQSVKWNAVSWIDRSLQRRSAAILNEFIQLPRKSDLWVVCNAATLLRFSVFEEHHIHLLDATQIVIHERALECNEERLRLLSVLFDRLIDAIAHVEPEMLLAIDLDQEWVDAAMMRLVRRQGWLLFHDRIVDQRMRTIASRSEDPIDKHRASTPEVVQQIIEELPPRQRNDFLSYWHIISEGDSDYVHTDRETVHQAICSVMESETHTLLSQRLQACYGDGEPPSFGSWKKNLTRVVNRCCRHPEWLAHLQRIGLTPGPRKAR